ncbi:MAG: DUF4097 family beta strand repeat-containing protein [Acidobacteriota bacterium]|nr:DUF4097 family beta strand repeat-containing protein [Acidobacteriota bacterium]
MAQVGQSLRSRLSWLFLAVAAVLLFTSNLRAQDSDVRIQSDHFSWQQKLAPDQVIDVRGLSGDVRAAGYDGAEVEVTAEKSGADAGSVQIQIIPNAEGVIICAVYPGMSNDCSTRSNRRERRSTRARVDFTVKVPRDIRFVGSTVNGSVDATGLARRGKVSSVNGSVRVQTAEWAEATTVNGSVIARFGKADWPGTLHLSTVNGRIELEIAGDLNAEVSTSSVNGSVQTDFPITVAGRMRRGNLHGVIGKGGRELELTTVNGDMELRKPTL